MAHGRVLEADWFQMCQRRLFAAICLALFTSACASSATEADNAAQPTLQPDSLALVDETAADPESVDNLAVSDPSDVLPEGSDVLPEGSDVLPEGSAPPDLPDALEDRMDVMTAWLRSFGPAMNAGNEPMSIGDNGEIEAHFLVRTTDVREAEGLCDIYSSAVDLYAGDNGADVNISLSGWVLSDAGVFVDPGWATISCNI